MLDGLMLEALAIGDVRMDKVRTLQRSIAAGGYHVSSTELADKVVREMLRGGADKIGEAELGATPTQ